MASEARTQPGILARTLAGAVGVIGRHPWLVLGAVLLSCAASAYLTCTRLSYLSNRNDLISSNKDYLKRWRQYVAEFGEDDDMVVAVQGSDRAAMERVLDELAGEIDKHPDAFERLFYKADLTSLHSRALLFLPTDQIRIVQDYINGPTSLLLDPPVIGKLDPLFGWKSLSIEQLLHEAERKLQVWKDDPPSKDAEDFFRQLEVIAHGASDCLAAPGKYRNPWRSVLPQQKGPSQEDQLSKPQYFFSADGKLAFLLVSPVTDKDADSYTNSRTSIDRLRALVAEVKERHPEVDIGLTGLPVLENDEAIASQDDSSRASWLALLGVAVLYIVVYRGFRFPVTTVASLLVGAVWTLGWLTLTIGHLNILSSAFAVMLIGIGDYGVLWVTRFGREREAGRDIAGANRETALRVGPSILTAAVTTAFAFFAAMFADLKAVTELGWIVGCGVLLCALSCFVVVPALLALLDYRLCPKEAANPDILSLEKCQAMRREWLPWLLHRPRWVVGVAAAAVLLIGCYAVQIRYDHNLLNLQSPSMASVQWECKLMEHMGDSSWYAVTWTSTPEEAIALKDKFEKLPEVSMVVTMASLVPPDQERKIEMLRDINQKLSKLPERGKIVQHATPNIADIKQTGVRVLKLLAARQKEKPNASMAQLEVGLTRLLASIKSAEGEAPAEPALRSLKALLKQYDEWIARDLADDLHRLRDVSTPTPIRLDEVPADLRERYIGKNGKWLVRVFSKECLWDFEPMERFVGAVRSVDAGATGKPFTTLEGLKAMSNGFLWAACYALIAMIVVLLVDFGKIKHMLIAMLPLALGMVATLGFMALLGYALNPANMIGFPLILGVGADNGVHVLHDFRNRDRKERYRLTHIIGFGILVKALTTVLGFGTLMIAQHRGMSSLGLILTIGVTCCMLTALVFLPALLQLLSTRDKKPAAETPATLPLPGRGREAA
jgi:hopanoid biosynthesis associated RND transporter like protein HpnN